MEKTLPAMVQDAEYQHLINYKMTVCTAVNIFTWCTLKITAIFKINALYHGV